VNSAWRRIGKVGMLIVAALAGVNCSTALASEIPMDPSIPSWELLMAIGPLGVVAYFAVTVGHHRGLPVSVTIRLSEESLKVLEKVARTTIIQRYYSRDDEPKEPPRRGGFTG